MKRTIVVVLLLASCSAWGADNAGQSMVQADKACGRFINDALIYQRNPKEALDHAVSIAWIAGFITGINVTLPDTYSILGPSDMQSAILWLDTWCKANPLRSLSEAMGALVIELYPRRYRTREESGQ